ncbi:MAG: ComEA family DNA-binding protein [Phycisphaeraceae bacterium JB051]
MSEPKTPPPALQAERVILRRLPIVLAMIMVMLLMVLGILQATGNTLDQRSIQPITTDFLININTDNAGNLMLLPGVGKVIANRIIEHRQQHGPFTSIQQLDDISGISHRTIARLEPFLLPLSDDLKTEKKRHRADAAP